jgi:putative serine protease PepD
MSDAPAFTRAERCPRCGQPLVMGACTLCGSGGARPAPSGPPAPGAPATGTTDPGAGPAGKEPKRAAAGDPIDRRQTLVGVAFALLVLSLLASLFLIAKVSSLEGKVSDEQAARSQADTRVATLEGSLKVVQDDQQKVHAQLDAIAAADPTAIAAKVQPSVYTIETPNGAIGSAWVAFSDHTTAKFVTNYHVIADAWESGGKQVAVYQDQGQRFIGTIETALPDVDLALVDVTADIPALKQSNETPASGETIVVIGSPLGFGGTVSTGTVSASRDFNGIHLIQFAAPTSPGNSGGPIVNGLGEVIGITELDLGRVVQGSENAKFAIPVNQVCLSLKVC